MQKLDSVILDTVFKMIFFSVIPVSVDASFLFFFLFPNEREGMPHGIAVSGTKFNISEVKLKDYAYKFFCHFIYDSQEFTSYIKLEHPGKLPHLDKIMIIDDYFPISLTPHYL